MPSGQQSCHCSWPVEMLLHHKYTPASEIPWNTMKYPWYSRAWNHIFGTVEWGNMKHQNALPLSYLPWFRACSNAAVAAKGSFGKGHRAAHDGYFNISTNLKITRWSTANGILCLHFNTFPQKHLRMSMLQLFSLTASSKLFCHRMSHAWTEKK